MLDEKTIRVIENCAIDGYNLSFDYSEEIRIRVWNVVWVCKNNSLGVPIREYSGELSSEIILEKLKIRLQEAEEEFYNSIQEKIQSIEEILH